MLSLGVPQHWIRPISPLIGPEHALGSHSAQSRAHRPPSVFWGLHHPTTDAVYTSYNACCIPLAFVYLISRTYPVPQPVDVERALRREPKLGSPSVSHSLPRAARSLLPRRIRELSKEKHRGRPGDSRRFGRPGLRPSFDSPMAASPALGAHPAQRRQYVRACVRTFSTANLCCAKTRTGYPLLYAMARVRVLLPASSRSVLSPSPEDSYLQHSLFSSLHGSPLCTGST
ncbi:hypothetical protein C8Q77DRAFT_12177 [Trametes polyzona]|nr:hypothetical protein C8Q77DRAFT_12177 [Trametes polyzona]